MCRSLAIFRLAAAVGLLGGAVLGTAGCDRPARTAGGNASAPPAPSQPLVLLVVEDPPLGQAIAREWRSRTEQELTLREATLADLAAAHRLPGDVVIFPSGLVGQLAERGLTQPLAGEALDTPEFDFRDIFDQIRLREMKWGGRVLAVPLGSPQLLLAYRSDVFERLELAPPKTWSDYQWALARLSDRSALGEAAPGPDQPWQAALEPLGEGWAGQMLLARAAAYALHRDQISPLFEYGTLRPLVDQPPYVKALKELTAAAKEGGFANQRLSPTETLAALARGECAMAIGWPAAGSADGSAASGGKAIRFAILPGANEAYRFATQSWEARGGEDPAQVPLLGVEGRMAAVTASTADLSRAQGFLLWLAGREVSSVVSPQSRATSLFRFSQASSAGRWAGSLGPEAAQSYAATLEATLCLPRAFPAVALPGRLEYLAALDRAVLQAVAGEQTPEAALKTAADQWQQITDRLGRAEQKRAVARSLGQEEL